METIRNGVGIELPVYIEGYGPVVPYGAKSAVGKTVQRCPVKGRNKLYESVDALMAQLDLYDGMTVSFHHHLRNGDAVLNTVLSALAAHGIRDIHVAASGIFPCHDPLVEWIRKGVVTKITTSTFNPGPVAKAITSGAMKKPAVLMTHGGRARAIEFGDLRIDVAFIAAPQCDPAGNMNAFGPSGCGCLSYAAADAQYAKCVVALTDHLVSYPCLAPEIGEDLVDYVLKVDSIGDPRYIASGTTKITEDPTRLKIASLAAEVMDAAGMIYEDMSFQTGASGISLAVAAQVRQRMKERGITGSYGLGGIHSYMVKMLEEGLFRALLDVQCFDLEAVLNLERDPRHMIISGSRYASLNAGSRATDRLDTVILGATEIDLDYNVNVVTGSDGVIIGASGGHSDCAAGAKLTIVVTTLTRKKFCIVRDRVTCVTTPGSDIDVLVTEYGISINPKRDDLLKKLSGSGLPLMSINEQKALGESLVGPQLCVAREGRIVGVVEYRDGSVIDLSQVLILV